MTVIRAPHTREEHLAGSIVLHIARTVCLDISVLSVLRHRRPVCSLLDVIRRVEILSVYKRVTAVLLTSEITHESIRIIRLILVCWSLCA